MGNEIKLAKSFVAGESFDGNDLYAFDVDSILAERESIYDAFVFLKLNWGTTEGYERLKEYINEREARKDGK